jgi:hypothetical protein
MDRLSKSLDQIIEEKQPLEKKIRNRKFSVDHRDPSGKTRNYHVRNEHRDQMIESRRNYHDKKPGYRNFYEKNEVPQRPMKIITIERPKIIQPPESSINVFKRLGQTTIPVFFENLKRSVKESDIQELCAVLGEFTEVSLTLNAFGIGTAKVLFTNMKVAEECVERYNGKNTSMCLLYIYIYLCMIIII